MKCSFYKSSYIRMWFETQIGSEQLWYTTFTVNNFRSDSNQIHK